ncbi:MAG: PEP-CTERM sorting domain-containing protein [Pirellulales bacterium]
MKRSLFARSMAGSLVATLLVVASCLTSTIANAQESVPLSELLDGGSIGSGDKLFDQFSYSASGDMPDSTGVNVIPIVDDDGNFGIRFQGAFLDLYSTDGDRGSDALIGFTVSVTDPERLISDAHLMGNPNLLGADVGSISVTETFGFDATGAHQLNIFDDEGAGTLLRDWTLFDQPRSALIVLKDINAFAAEQGSVTLSFVDQTFSQIGTPVVPEASTGLLMLLGLATLAATRRARRQ